MLVVDFGEEFHRTFAESFGAATVVLVKFLGRVDPFQLRSEVIAQVLAIEKDGVTMPESERRNKEAEAGRLNRDLQRLQREFREDLNLRKNEELSQVLERANKVIQEIAEKEKYDLILQEAVYRSPRIDITEKVLKALADK